MELSYFDLHCDTAYEMYRQKKDLTDDALSVSFQKTSEYVRYRQVMAFWTPPELSDEDGWEQFLAVYTNFCRDPAVTSGMVRIFPDYSEDSPVAVLFSVEDARILCGHLDRLETLAALGIRFLIPFWKGLNCLGGAHDTNIGLTDFGKEAIRSAIQYGMIPDISHASQTSAEGILDICASCGVPCIASHSNAYDVCHVSRNLPLEMIQRIVHSGGIIGLNLHSPFLKSNGKPCVVDVIRHIDYFMEHGAEDLLCFGCDFDGGTPPQSLSSPNSLITLSRALLSHGYSESQIKKIFFENANHFFSEHFSERTER